MKRGFLNKPKAKKTAAPEPKAILNVVKDKPQLPTANAVEKKPVEASSSIKQGSSLNSAKAKKAASISTAEGRTVAGYSDNDKLRKTIEALMGYEDLEARMSFLGVSPEELLQPGDRLDYDAKQIIVTTLSFSDNPNDATECLLRGITKGKIYSTPGFPRALPQLPYKTPPYRIGSSPFGGKGTFATRPLHTGDIIMYDRPLVVCPPGLAVHPSQFPPHFTTQQLIEATTKEFEKCIDVVFKRMTSANQQRFLALANSVENGGFKGILATNGYQITEISDGNSLVDSYAAICDEMSRINHSCGPNTAKSFDVASFSFALRAIRSIEEGEEITTSYCDIYSSKTKRQRFLDGYGFKCACTPCLNATPGTDLLRQNLSSRVDRCVGDLESWRKKGSPRRQDAPQFKATLKLLADIEQEGLQCSQDFLRLVGLIANTYRALKDAPNAAKYAKLAGDLVVALNGELTENMEKWLINLNVAM